MPTEEPPTGPEEYLAPEDLENESEAPTLTSPGVPFQCLGYDRGSYYYLSRKTQQVVELRPEGHTGKSLLQLAPLSWWNNHYPGKKNADWDAAADALMMQCNQAGVFDPSRIRGRGAWEDNGRSVLHTGGHLVVNGTVASIDGFESRYVYEVARDLDQEVSRRKLSNEEANQFLTLCESLSWSKPINAALLAGWCVIAPICGAMTWRPHMWLTGARGTGKTWVLENIIKPAVGGSALSVMASTTEAGIRQTLGNDARPVVFDEAEGEDLSAQKRVQAVLELARQASSESEGAIYKGSAGGRSIAFRIRSCFLFSSIGVSITQSSDASRVSILSLAKNSGPDSFERLRKSVFELLTPEYCAALRARSVALIPQIRRNYEVFRRACGEHFGDQRTGDQVGALIAGCYTLGRTGEATLDDAREWVQRKAAGDGWEDVQDSNDEGDEKRCLAAILGHVVKIKDRETTLGELVLRAIGYAETTDQQRAAEEVIRIYGIRSVTGVSGTVGVEGVQTGFIVSNTAEKIKQILRNTPWVNGWRGLLLRLPLAEKTNGITFSPGVRSRGVFLDQSVLD
jgi:putative DNA primase/helicase